jgi:hypothetical protein
VPKLIVQPLAENCFKHGFSGCRPPWRIDIRPEPRKRAVGADREGQRRWALPSLKSTKSTSASSPLPTIMSGSFESLKAEGMAWSTAFCG